MTLASRGPSGPGWRHPGPDGPRLAGIV